VRQQVSFTNPLDSQGEARLVQQCPHFLHGERGT
jgi:hypothetical protein